HPDVGATVAEGMLTVRLLLPALRGTLRDGSRCETDMKPFAPLLVLTCLLPAVAWSSGVPGGGIDSDRLATHLRILASDEFEGRAPTTAGEEKTVAYISEQFA